MKKQLEKIKENTKGNTQKPQKQVASLATCTA